MLVTLFSVKTMESLQIGGATPFWMESIVSIKVAYPKMGKNTLKTALWTFKQQLTLNKRACCGISNLAPVNILVALPVGVPTYNFVKLS